MYIEGNVIDSAKSALKTVKHSVGQIVRAPGEVAEALSTTAKGVGKGVTSTTKSVPIVLIIAAVGVAGFLLFMGKAGKNIVPGVKVGENFPELLGGRCGGRGSRRRRKR
jgi:hypothetical protein